MLQATPWRPTFSQDMFYNVPLFSDWLTILTLIQQLVNDVILNTDKNALFLTIRFAKSYSIWQKNWRQNNDPLTLWESIPMEQWLLPCILVYLNMYMVGTPCQLYRAYIFVSLTEVPWIPALIAEMENVMPSCELIPRHLLWISVHPDWLWIGGGKSILCTYPLSHPCCILFNALSSHSMFFTTLWSSIPMISELWNIMTQNWVY